MDQRVLETQTWLNETYGSNPNFVKVDEDGVTGRGTVKGLIRGLQIELGESTIDGIIGDATCEEFDAMFPNGLSQNVINPNENIVYIMQGGFYCRGIDPHGFNGIFGNGLTDAVKTLQSQAGLENLNGIITPMILKAILTTDAYTLLSNGDAKIREIQQGLNRKYYLYIGLIPTNGIYDRQTSKALIKALQKEIGVDVDGIWGPGTLDKCPTLQRGSTKKNLVYILQYALYVNGFDPNGFDGGFGNGVVNAVTAFQAFVALGSDGIVGKQTWASLMISYGDKNRTATACDTNTTITSNLGKLLKKNGYNIVGRYLADTKKGLKEGELSTIFDAGLKMFPIFQGNGREEADFTEEFGLRDARKASSIALEHGLPEGTIIYFAVDFDAMDYQVTNSIIPYFKGINYAISNRYKVGIYGPRNVCSRVKKAGYSVSSFVSDMSSGFSGNIGYKLPDDWEYDQIANITLSDNEYGNIEIDRVVYRGNLLPVVSYDFNLELYRKLEKVYNYAQEYLSNKGNDSIANRNDLVLQYLRTGGYSDIPWLIVAGGIDNDFIDFLHTKDDLPAVDSFRIFIKSVKKYMTISHMAATAQVRFKHNDISDQNQWVDLTGIFGDLLQLGGCIQKKYDSNPEKYHYDEFEIMELIGCLNDEIAQKYGFETAKKTGFNWEDWYQDIDGVNIAVKLENTPIHKAFQDYYSLGGVNQRYNSFFTNIGLAAYAFVGEMKFDTIYRKAYSYTSATDPYVTPFEMLFGIFNSTLWGEVLAKAFASVLNSGLINEE